MVLLMQMLKGLESSKYVMGLGHTCNGLKKIFFGIEVYVCTAGIIIFDHLKRFYKGE